MPKDERQHGDKHKHDKATEALIGGLPLSAWARIFAFHYHNVNAVGRTDGVLHGAQAPLLVSRRLLDIARRALYASPTVLFDRIEGFHHACWSGTWEPFEPVEPPADERLHGSQRLRCMRRNGPFPGTYVRNLTVFTSQSDDPSIHMQFPDGGHGAVHRLLPTLLSPLSLASLTLIVRFSTGPDAHVLLAALRAASVSDKMRIELRMMPAWDEKLLHLGGVDASGKEAEAEAAREAEERAFYQDRKIVADMLRSYAAAVSGRLEDRPPVRPPRSETAAEAFADEFQSASDEVWKRECAAYEWAQRQVPVLSLAHVFELNWRVLERNLDTNDTGSTVDQIVDIENRASWPRYGSGSGSPPAAHDARERLIQKLWRDIYPYAEDDPLPLTDEEYHLLLRSFTEARCQPGAPQRGNESDDDDDYVEINVEGLVSERSKGVCDRCGRPKDESDESRRRVASRRDGGPHICHPERVLRCRVLWGTMTNRKLQTDAPSHAKVVEAVHNFFYWEMLRLQDKVRARSKSAQSATKKKKKGLALFSRRRAPAQNAGGNELEAQMSLLSTGVNPYVMAQLDAQQLDGIVGPFTVAVGQDCFPLWKELGFHSFNPSQFFVYGNEPSSQSSSTPSASQPTHTDNWQTRQNLEKEELLPPVSFPYLRILTIDGGRSKIPLKPLAWLANIVPVLPASKSLPVFKNDSGSSLAILLGAKLGQAMSKWNTKAFSFVAEDPIAARAFSGDLWPQLKAEYIRVKVPATLHPLDVFRTWSDPDGEHLLNPATRAFEFEVQDVNRFDDRWLDPSIPMEAYRIPAGRDSWDAFSPSHCAPSYEDPSHGDPPRNEPSPDDSNVAPDDAAHTLDILSPLPSSDGSVPSSPAFSFTSDASYVDIDSDELELEGGAGEGYDAAAAAAQLKRIQENRQRSEAE